MDYFYKYIKYKERYLNLKQTYHIQEGGRKENSYYFYKKYKKKFDITEEYNKIYKKYYKLCIDLYKTSNVLNLFITAWEYDALNKNLYNGYFVQIFEKVFSEKINYDNIINYYKDAAIRDFMLDNRLVWYE